MIHHGGVEMSRHSGTTGVCLGGCQRSVGGGRVFCPVCFRRLPTSMQDMIQHGAARNRRVSKQAMKVTLKAAQAYLRDKA